MSSACAPKELRLAGYFPKQIVPRPAWLQGAPSVVDICSVSHCISPPPDDWIYHWLHNELAFYDRPELAGRVVPASEDGFTIFCYRLGTVRFFEGRPEVWTWPAIDPQERAGYRSLGFDVIGKIDTGFLGFEHSPLSCNSMASEYPVNAHCLLDDLSVAVATAQQFSTEQPEPGAYHVAEVLLDAGKESGS